MRSKGFSLKPQQIIPKPQKTIPKPIKTIPDPFKTNQKLSWDADNNKFSDSRVNDKYLMKDYHNGYKLPK